MGAQLYRAWIWKLILAQAAFLVGLLCWGTAVASGLGVFKPPRNLQMPMGTIGDIELDTSGRIYLALQLYGRVQVYASDGGFLHGWQVDTGGGTMKMEIDPADRIHIVVHRVYRHYVFSPSGDLLEEAEVDGDYIRCFGDGSPLAEHGASRIWYQVRWRTLFPCVVKLSRADTAIAAVSTPLWLWVAMAPFPSLLWGLVGVAGSLQILLTHSLRHGKDAA